MAIIFDPMNRIIEIEAPAIEVTIQELINAIRDWEDEQSSMGYPHIAEGSGKEELGGGVLVGITLKLLNWRLKFADRAGPDWIVCNVRGGNLVAVDENGESMYAIAPANYVTVTLTSSSSATISELQLEDLKYRVESLRTAYFAFGETIYWDPTNGDDGNSGFSPDTPVKTYTKAESLVTEYANDSIVIMAQTNPITVNFTVTKSGLHIRGSGYHSCNFETSGVTAITISANLRDVSIEQFAVNAGLNGVVVQSGCESISLMDFKIENVDGNGVYAEEVNFLELTNGQVTASHLSNIKLKNCGKVDLKIVFGVISETAHGLEVENTVYVVIHENCIFGGNAGYGIFTNNLPPYGKIVLPLDASLGGNALGTFNDVSKIVFPYAQEVIDIIKKIQTNRWKIIGNQLIIYDDDGVTPLKTFNLSGTQDKSYGERTPV